MIASRAGAFGRAALFLWKVQERRRLSIRALTELVDKAGAVIGRIEHLSEDKRGLRVIAELGEGVDAARAARLVRSGRLDGLSFGYRVREAGKSAGLRELRELGLVEVSLVAEPMQPKARVHAVE
jgi:HK97 family phage prohead protease